MMTCLNTAYGFTCLVLILLFPPHCRCHIITQFNQGFYDYIIATDEQSLADPTAAAAAAAQAPTGKGKRKKPAEKEGK